MFRFPILNIDRLSFFLGFLAATLFWWVFNRFRPYLPQYWARAVKAVRELWRQSRAGAELQLRRELVRRSQRSHLAAPLFALDEILVEPRLIAPPPAHTPGLPPPEHTVARQILPYVPDWPEMISPLGAPTLSLPQALANGCNLAIIGQPGSGKTVALASLAGWIARGDPRAGWLRGALPMFVHVIDLSPSDQPEADPAQALIKAVSAQVNLVSQPQLARALTTAFRDPERKLLLMLDGLDELPRENLVQACAYLSALLARLPNLQVVAAASGEYLDGLVKAGFVPVGIAAWNHAQRAQYLRRWGELWHSQVLPEARKHFQGPDVDPLLIHHWLLSDLSLESPLELTLKTWSAFAGDLNGSSLSHVIKNHISRMMPVKNLLPALDVLAHQFVKHTTPWMEIDDIEKILSGYQPPAAQSAAEVAPGAEMSAPAPRGKGAIKRAAEREALVTQGERIIAALANGGVLTQHPGGRVRFSSPIFTGFLASTLLKPEEVDGLAQKLEWSIAAQALRFQAACLANPPWLLRMLEDQGPPLYRNLMVAARWLADAPPSSEWRITMLRALAGLLQNDSVPLGTRARVATAFLTSKDPSAARLFKQLLTSHSFNVRQLAVLGLGAFGNPQHLTDVIEMFADPEAIVRDSALLAVSAIPGDTALSALVEVLMQGDEDFRKAAAEALALNPVEGKQVLEEMASVDDLLTRRAVVFGLIQIREEWSKKLLEKIAVEDGQWVVRNAATHALEEFQKPNPDIPRPLPAPSENPWMLAFAGKLGMGIRPGVPATDVLVAAVKTGTVEEQIAAMEYLRAEPSDGVCAAIYPALYGSQETLHEPALTALWMMALSGFTLPNPVQFGLS